MFGLTLKIVMIVMVSILVIGINVSTKQFASAQEKSLTPQSQLDRLPLQQKLDVGLQVTQRQGQQYQLNPHGTAWVSVNCLIGETVIGGGYNIVGPVGKLSVTGEAKTGNGWGVRGENNSDNLAATVTPYAMCAKLVSR